MITAVPAATLEQRRSERQKKIFAVTATIWEHPSFFSYKGRVELLAPMPDHEKYLKNKEVVQAKRFQEKVPQELWPLYEEPLLTKKQEWHLFRQYNFLKYRARQNALWRHANRAERLMRRANQLKHLLTLANARWAYRIIKGIYCRVPDDLLSEALGRVTYAVDMFNYDRTNGQGDTMKFCTYVFLVVKNHCLREAGRLNKHFSSDPQIIQEIVSGDSGFADEYAHQDQKRLVAKLLTKVPRREAEILRRRFGIGGSQTTLEGLGEEQGISKERIRQLEQRGLQQIREWVVSNGVVFE